MYATVDDVRREGISETQASEERLRSLLDEASRAIERFTGGFFEPRERVLRLDGRGTPTLELPVPPIRLVRGVVDGDAMSLVPADLVIVGAPVEPDFVAPRVTRTRGRVFPRGAGNVELEGLWGYTEADGTPIGRTPLEIRRVCMLLVLRWLSPLGRGEDDARLRWRILSERTRDQSYTLDRLSTSGRTFTGDPEIDGILLRYRRPMGLGAA